ncbi:CBS domain-containing protein [Candidatus Woesearchaeota archaeon]|nr:CBS domain-containing protein [Candidatus Woesearchaeota archaeon]
MKVKDALLEVKAVEYDDPVFKVAELMQQYGVYAIVVKRSDKMVGIITERDILRKIVMKGLDSKTTLANQIMNSPVVTIGPDEEISYATRLMAEKNIRGLICVEDGAILGNITARSISENLGPMLSQPSLGGDRTPSFAHYF